MIATKPTASKAATNGHGPASSGFNLRRKTSLAAGVLYVLTFVSMPTLVLYGPVKTANYILGAGPDTGALFGVILEIVVALAGIGTAVALFPVLKRQNEGIAMALIGNRVLEAATIFVGVMCLLTVVSLRQTGAGADALVSPGAARPPSARLDRSAPARRRRPRRAFRPRRDGSGGGHRPPHRAVRVFVRRLADRQRLSALSDPFQRSANCGTDHVTRPCCGYAIGKSFVP